MCTSGTQPQRQLNDMHLENWFISDCLFENLTTVINRVVLAPEPPEVAPITYSSDSDLEWENSEVDTEMTDVNLEAGSSNILMLTEPNNTAWNASESEMMRYVLHLEDSPPLEEVPGRGVLALPSSSAPMETEENTVTTVAVHQEMSVVAAHQSTSEQAALPSTGQFRALTAGNEVGRTGSNWFDTSSSSTELVPSTSAGHHHHRKSYPFRRRQTLEGSNSNPQSVKLNESIVSLLLKLHWQLAGVPDSYNSEEEESGTSGTSGGGLIGDGPYTIGRLLRKISRLDENCKNYIQETRMKLWPTQEERDEAKKQKKNREKEDFKRRAKETQQKMMADMMSRQRLFMEKAMETDENAMSKCS